MTDNHIEPETGSYSLTGRQVDLRVLRDLALDPSGPFFRFVLTYLAASAGLTPVYDAGRYSQFMRDVAGIFPGSVAGDARADLGKCVELVREGNLPQREAEISLCCMLANTAHESLTDSDKTVLSRTAEGQFLRHVRNAASHGNRWHFTNREPSQVAAWRGKEIDQAKKGSDNPLHGNPCFYGDMMPADLLYLLSDIEKLLRP